MWFLLEKNGTIKKSYITCTFYVDTYEINDYKLAYNKKVDKLKFYKNTKLFIYDKIFGNFSHFLFLLLLDERRLILKKIKKYF